MAGDDIPATLIQVEKLAQQESVLIFVNRYRTIDGNYRYIQWRAQPFGELIYAAGRDITEARLAEERLHASERLFRALFEQSNDAVIIFDMEGKNKLVNKRAAELLGYTLDKAYNLNIAAISADLNQSENVLERLMAGEQIHAYERNFRHKDGSIIPVEVNISLIYDEKGMMPCIFRASCATSANANSPKATSAKVNASFAPCLTNRMMLSFCSISRGNIV